MAVVSRRSAIAQLSTAAVGMALIPRARAAEPPKLPQKSVAYRTKPDGDRKCDNCKLFIKPNGCEKVQGEISPEGYCILYQKV
jgi:hypothetical protein